MIPENCAHTIASNGGLCPRDVFDSGWRTRLTELLSNP